MKKRNALYDAPNPTTLRDLKSLDGSDNLAIAAEEGQQLFDLVRVQQPKVILEVGTGHGYSTLWLVLAMQVQAMLYTIDREDYAHLLENRFVDGRKMVQLTGELKDLINDLPETIDLVFLDSQHQIEKIVADVERIERRLSDKGVIVVHDTEYCPEMGRCLADYFLGIDSERLKKVGVKPSNGAWFYEGIKTQYGLGIARRLGKGKHGR